MSWPEDEDQFRKEARKTFLQATANNAQYWFNFGEDFVSNEEPAEPYVRSWSDVAKNDRAYREVFKTLNDEQKEMVRKLLWHCTRGTAHSMVTLFDQFPGGEAEIWIWNDVCGDGTRKVMISPDSEQLAHEIHDYFEDPNGVPSDEGS